MKECKSIKQYEELEQKEKFLCPDLEQGDLEVSGHKFNSIQKSLVFQVSKCNDDNREQNDQQCEEEAEINSFIESISIISIGQSPHFDEFKFEKDEAPLKVMKELILDRKLSSSSLILSETKLQNNSI